MQGIRSAARRGRRPDAGRGPRAGLPALPHRGAGDPRLPGVRGHRPGRGSSASSGSSSRAASTRSAARPVVPLDRARRGRGRADPVGRARGALGAGERRADDPRVPRRGRPAGRVAAGGARARAAATTSSRPFPTPATTPAISPRGRALDVRVDSFLGTINSADSAGAIRRTRRARGRRLRLPVRAGGPPSARRAARALRPGGRSRERVPISSGRSGCASGSRASGRTPSRGACRSTTGC